HDQCVEIRTAERMRRDAHADRCADRAAGLGQQTYVIDRLAHFPIREFEGGDYGAGHHVEAGEDDKTDALHRVSSAGCPKTPFICNLRQASATLNLLARSCRPSADRGDEMMTTTETKGTPLIIGLLEKLG